MIHPEHLHAKKFIFEALHLQQVLPELVAAQQMCTRDWEYLLHIAQIHRLGPMLYVRLKREDLVSAIPEKVQRQLKKAHRRHTFRNLNIYRELVSVTRILESANIPSIALKGAFLAYFAYPDVGMRPMRDLDLLLPPEQAIQAFELLKAHGYKPMFDGAPEAYFADRIHLPPLTGPGGITIELHHRLTAPDSNANGFEHALWARSISIMVGGTHVKFLSHEDLLLHLCIHAILDHQLDLGPLSLADVALLIESKPVDWQLFLSIVVAGGWQRCVLPLLSLAKSHLGAKVPDEIMVALGGTHCEPVWLESAEYLVFSDPADHKLLDYDVQEMLYAGNAFKRLSALIGIAFPPRATIARHFPVSADSFVAYLYYPRRWYRLLTGKLPSLLKAHSGREGTMRELALQRNALSRWLKAAAK